MRLLLVDAFTDVPFAGNPAGVCLLEDERPADWMQSLAAEMNQAETAFVRPVSDHYDLRWFTPTLEVDLCGHATLASAHALWSVAGAEGDLAFETRSGRLTALRQGDLIQLDFPAEPADRPTAIQPELILEALGCLPVSSQANRMDLLVELPSGEAVRSLRPNLNLINDFPYRGVIVTARDNEHDFISRFFAPAFGVPEDSVTGSAHCALAPFWAEKLGKQDMSGYQASKRGGVVKVTVKGDRVLLGGKAKTVFDGQLLV